MGGGKGDGIDGGGCGGGGDGGGDSTVHEPSSRLAEESKLRAACDMQPRRAYVQHLTHAVLASAAKLRAAVSMQPVTEKAQDPSIIAVASES